MNLIIDTQIFLWALTTPAKTSQKNRAALEDLGHTIFVSAVTVL